MLKLKTVTFRVSEQEQRALAALTGGQERKQSEVLRTLIRNAAREAGLRQETKPEGNREKA